MDVYGGIVVDDLLDLPNDDFFSSSTSSSSSAANAVVSDYLHHHQDSHIPSYSTDFTDALFIPTEDAAELEWVSSYMDDSYADFPTNHVTVHHQQTSGAFHSRARSKRSRPSNSSNQRVNSNNKKREDLNGEEDGVVRRCSHCASEKTPQWRTGPMGPKTLCNACGVRYKSGRLVPEYRPAASPTFVLTQHSNSHRKVLELRRQKEVVRHHQQ